MGVINKPVLVEFNGLPGSGNTTVTNLLCNKPDAAGYNVDHRENTYLINRGESLGLGWRVLKSGEVILPWKLLKFYLSIEPFRFDRTHQIKWIYDWIPSSQALWGRWKGMGRNHRVRGVRPVGSVHGVPRHLPKEEGALGSLEVFLEKINFIIVECSIDESMASDWILSRQGKTERFDRMAVTHLEGNLARHNRNLEIVRKNLRYMGCPETVKIDMGQSAEKNCEQVFQIVEREIRRSVEEISQKGGKQYFKDDNEGL